VSDFIKMSSWSKRRRRR